MSLAQRAAHIQKDHPVRDGHRHAVIRPLSDRDGYLFTTWGRTPGVVTKVAEIHGVTPERVHFRPGAMVPLVRRGYRYGYSILPAN